MKICSVEACDRKLKARGWCALHYGRWVKYKDINRTYPVMRKSLPIETRFWRYVVKNDDINDCWEWIGTKNPAGYGMIKQYGKINIMAHRLSYILFKGEFKKELHACHTCDNPSCVNPNHLFIGTDKDNIQDMVNKGRGKSNRGINNPAAKLKDSDIPIIRERLKSGELQWKIAKDYSITQSTVSSIKYNRSWKDI